MNPDFQVVMDRLKARLAVRTDADLADRLGISRTSYANRKKAGSIPLDEIYDLAVKEGVSLDELFGLRSSRGVTAGAQAQAVPAPTAPLDLLLMQRVAEALGSALCEAEDVEGRHCAVDPKEFAALVGLVTILYRRFAEHPAQATADPALQALARQMAAAWTARPGDKTGRGVPGP